jgi:hypothetical protein
MDGPISDESAPAVPTLEIFTPALGEAFTVGSEGGATVELVLAEAAAEDSGEHAPRPPFSLLFEGPAEPLLPQGTYRFEHGSLGVLEIFIVPLGRDGHGSAYQAVYA